MSAYDVVTIILLGTLALASLALTEWERRR